MPRNNRMRPRPLSWDAYARRMGSQASASAYEKYLKKMKGTNMNRSSLQSGHDSSLESISSNRENERASQILEEYNAMLVRYQESGTPLTSDREFARAHNVPASTFRKWKSQGRPVQQVGRKTCLPLDLEKQIEATALNKFCTEESFKSTDIRSIASQIAIENGYLNFNASNGWLDQFLKRATKLKEYTTNLKMIQLDKELFIIAAMKRARILPLTSFKSPTIHQLKALSEKYFPTMNRVLKRSEYVELLNSILDPDVRLKAQCLDTCNNNLE